LNAYECYSQEALQVSIPCIECIPSKSTACQIFAGTDSTVLDAYGMKTDAQFLNTLEDNIHFCRALAHLISNDAQAKTSNHVKDTLMLFLFLPG
jgi:hypothetical protein